MFYVTGNTLTGPVHQAGQEIGRGHTKQTGQHDVGQAHPANRTIWDRLTLQTEPYGTGSFCKQTHLRQVHPSNKTIWISPPYQDYDMGESHSAKKPFGTGLPQNKTIWDGSPWKTEPLQIYITDPENRGKGSAWAELLQQARLPKITICERHTLQTEPFDHAHRQITHLEQSHSANRTLWSSSPLKQKEFWTGSPCKQNHLIMLTDKQNYLEQAHPAGQTISDTLTPIAEVFDIDVCIHW